MNRDRLVQPLPGYQRRLGTALWVMQDTRSRTLQALHDLAPDAIDAVPGGAENSIGTLLYHVAAIELDWLFVDILERPFPHWADELFPADVRSDDGRLSAVTGVTLDEHLGRLARVRATLLEGLRDVGDTEYQRPRHVDGHMVTTEWVIHHLCQHEAEHRGHIQTIRTAVEPGSSHAEPDG